MNTRATYEILIAEKTAQLALPEMANSIWARIETELDAVMEEPAADDQPKPKTPPHNGAIRLLRPGIVTAAAAVILAAVWFVKNRPHTKKTTPVPVLKEEKKSPAVTDSSNIIPPPGKKNTSAKINERDLIKAVLKNPDSLPQPFDNGLSQPQREPANIDSFLPGTPVFNPVPDSSKKVTPQARPRGVKGISDNDYKIISVKRDSVKNKD